MFRRLYLRKMALTTPGDLQNDKTIIHKSSDRKEKPMTKVIIRRLPPAMTEEEFLNQVSPIPDYNYIYTVKGDMSLGENAFSRVYINFVSVDGIYNFKEKFDNYVFVDLKGHEYPAVVEFASFQKIPKRRNKSRNDPKCGTVMSDPFYIEFLESLKIQPSNDEKPEYSYQPSSENKMEDSTPLLDFIKQRRIDRQRIREEKREERKKKDIERKRIKDDERRKRYEEKSPSKTVVIKAPKVEDIKEEKSNEPDKKTGESSKTEEKHYTKYRDRKYEDRKSSNTYKSKYARTDRDFTDKHDYKSRRDDYRDRDYRHKPFEDYKRDPEKFTKKVKKYSEKREERKSALKKYEEHNEDNANKSEDKNDTKADGDKVKEKNIKSDDEKIEHSEGRKTSESDTEKDSRSKNKENDPRIQRRIRNKDRPTMAIYQPGMLRKKVGDEDKPSKTTVVDNKDT